MVRTRSVYSRAGRRGATSGGRWQVHGFAARPIEKRADTRSWSFCGRCPGCRRARKSGLNRAGRWRRAACLWANLGCVSCVTADEARRRRDCRASNRGRRRCRLPVTVQPFACRFDGLPLPTPARRRIRPFNCDEPLAASSPYRFRPASNGSGPFPRRGRSPRSRSGTIAAGPAVELGHGGHHLPRVRLSSAKCSRSSSGSADRARESPLLRVAGVCTGRARSSNRCKFRPAALACPALSSRRKSRSARRAAARKTGPIRESRECVIDKYTDPDRVEGQRATGSACERAGRRAQSRENSAG